jgi:hypothetical protein
MRRQYAHGATDPNLNTCARGYFDFAHASWCSVFGIDHIHPYRKWIWF